MRRLAVSGLMLLVAVAPVDGQDLMKPFQPVSIHAAMSEAEWRRVDRSVDRGLAWLARQQQPDGSFPASVGGQPAVTALATMAFLSRGHRPGVGPYGEQLDRAIDYTLSMQKPEGLFLLDRTDMPVNNWGRGAHTAMYNHAISGLMLGEAYGLTGPAREPKLRAAIEKALDYARKMQMRPSPYPLDKHAWRYYRHLNTPNKGEADLSVTGWFVMFYRSARNAEFDVPEQYVTDAIRYVKVCYKPDEGAFVYGPYRGDFTIGRGMTGAGLLCLAVAGQSDEKIARAAGKWLLEHPFDRYNVRVGSHDHFHYGAYYCSQAMFVLGGEYWRRFYPQLAKTLIDNQSAAGHWRHERPNWGVGVAYTTSLSILSLTPPYQLLPIYQR